MFCNTHRAIKFHHPFSLIHYDGLILIGHEVFYKVEATWAESLPEIETT